MEKSKQPQPVNIGKSTGIAMATGILLLAFAQAAMHLNADTLWADELSTLRNIGAFDPPYGIADIYESLATFGPQDVPLFFVLCASWARIGGWTQFALLLAPLWAGTLMLAILYRLTADLLSRTAALIAVYLLATNAFVLVYFHELRPYTLFLLFVVLHMWCYWRATRRSRFGAASAISFVVSAIALLYSHVFSIAAFSGLLLYHALYLRRHPMNRFVIAGWAVAAVAFVPQILRLTAGLGVVTEQARPAQMHDLLAVGARVTTNGCAWLWLALALAIVYGWRKARNEAVIFAGIVALGALTSLTLVENQFGLFALTRMRYTFAFWPPMIILFAFGLASLTRWPIATLALLAVWSFCGYQFVQSSEVLNYAGFTGRTRQYPRLNDFVFHLNGEVRSGDFLLGFTNLEQVNLSTGFSGHSVTDYYLGAQLGIDGYFLHASDKDYRLDRDVRDILAAHPRILLAHDPGDEPLNYARTLEIISKDFVSCAVLVDNPDLYIQRYVHPAIGCGRPASTIGFENGIQVLDYAAHYDAVSKSLSTLIWWRTPDESMLNEYNISLQILTLDWQNVRQLDRHLNDRIVPWRVFDLSTEDLPSGAYRLMLVLYRRDSGKRIRGLEWPSGRAEYMLPLMEFTMN